MSRRRDLGRKLDSLKDIEGIMAAMKSLAFMETRKLASFLLAQQRAVKSIEEAAGDFSNFYGSALREVKEICLLIGSERGLCGDFNEKVLLEAELGRPVVAIGSRLESKLSEPLALFPGANVAEEVEAILTAVVDFFATLQGKLPQEEVIGISAFYHNEEHGKIMKRRLLPLPQTSGKTYSHPPLLNVDPADFFEKLSEHYLYAALHEALYSSLMVENRYRLDHMENAMRQMDKKIGSLGKRYNELRQEEITEEIEVIMLSVGLDDGVSVC